jgi:hypothetical protein
VRVRGCRAHDGNPLGRDEVYPREEHCVDEEAAEGEAVSHVDVPGRMGWAERRWTRGEMGWEEMGWEEMGWEEMGWLQAGRTSRAAACATRRPRRRRRAALSARAG